MMRVQTVSDDPAHQTEPVEEGDPEWFREPTRREHWIAAGVFVVCGIFFILMFVVSSDGGCGG